jgi:hypothetical protein
MVVHMTDELSWLQQWYSAHCDGEWEHGPGIEIETLDNPGWSMSISVEGTELASATFETFKSQRSETNWVHCSLLERAPRSYRRFRGSGGASNLSEIIAIFRKWVESKP